MTTSATAIAPSSADKRRAIIDAALDLFADTGVHGTPIPPIAKAAGVGIGTLYRYFDNKEALVNAVYRAAKDDLQHSLLAEFDGVTSTRALFDTIWARLAGFARSRPAAFRFLEVQDHYRYLDTESRASERALLDPLKTLVQTGQQSGDLDTRIQPEIAITLFWGAFVGLFKAARLGYIELDHATLNTARDACWAALSRPITQ